MRVCAPDLPDTGRDPRAATAALLAGRPVVLAGQGPGRVLLAAQTATTEAVSWTVRHTSGLIRAVVPPERAARLRLPAMNGTDLCRTGLLPATSVDAGAGVGTGISAADRARTLRVLADPLATPTDLVSPGHVLVELPGTEPVPSEPGRAAATAVLLCLRAGLAGVAALAEVVDDRGEPVDGSAARVLAAEYGLPVFDCSPPPRTSPSTRTELR